MRPGGPESIPLGIALLGGGAGPGSEARTRALHSVLGPLLGEERPFSPFMPPRQTAVGRLVRVERKEDRVAAERAAKAFVRALFEADFGRLESEVDETLWVSWPSGQLGHHVGREVIRELRDRRTSPVAARWREVRSYTREELRLATPRGIVEALERFLLLRRGLAVTGTLELDGRSFGRVMVVMTSERGAWRASTLPLPAFDAAYVLSKRARETRDEFAHVAEKIVRGVVLGDRTGLEAERHLLLDPLWLSDELLPMSRLLRSVGGGPHRLSSLDIAFLGTRALDFSRLAKSLPRATFQQLEKSAESLFRRPLSKLDARAGVTVLGAVDPVRLETEPRQEALTWLVRQEDGLGRARVVVAGVFI